jgi:hypothetical protein
MNDLERQLKDALRRCDPPANFANRVLARVAVENDQSARRARSRFLPWNWPALRWGVVAAILCLAAGTGYRIRERRVEEAEAMAAKRQVMIALHITGAKLRIVQQRVKAVENAQEKTGKPL